MIANPIWQPKFKTREVLVSKLDVRPGKNYIYFVADRNHPDLYSYDGDLVREKGTLCSNGRITCYAFPLEWLTSEGDLPAEFIPIRDREYEKFKRFQAKK